MSLLGLPSCFAPLFLLAICVYCVRVLVVSLRVPGQAPGPACGKCGYSVAGLTTSECPECGSDLAKVGISTPFLMLRARGSTAKAIGAWTALICCAAFIALFFVGLRAARTGPILGNGSWTTPLIPNSAAFATVDAIAATTTLSGRSTPKSVALKLTLNDQSNWTMEYDCASQTYTIKDPSGTEVLPPTSIAAGAAAALYGAAGLGNSPSAAAEIAELDRVVSSLIVLPLTAPSQMALAQFTTGMTRGGIAMIGPAPRDPAEVIAAIFLFAFPAVWVLGVWWIVVRRRRLLAKCAT